MKFPLFCVVALLGAAVSAPAQVSIQGRIGRHVQGSVSIGRADHHGRHAHREPIRRLPVRSPVHGHWQTVCEQVLVPGCWREEHVPPTYGWVYDSCGHRYWDIVDHGGCRRVWVPPRYEHQNRRIWVPC